MHQRFYRSGKLKEQKGGNEAICSNLEDVIYNQTGLQVTVRIFDGKMKIKTDSWADYYIAKAAISGRTTYEISRITR